MGRVCLHEFSCGIQIDQHDTRVEKFMLGVQANMVDIICDVGESGVRCGCEGLSRQVLFLQRF